MIMVMQMTMMMIITYLRLFINNGENHHLDNGDENNEDDGDHDVDKPGPGHEIIYLRSDQ